MLFRSPNFLGTDLVLVDGDLSVTEAGDYAVVSDEDNVAEARMRRLKLPKGSAAVVIEDVNGLKVVNYDLGNDAHKYKSEPRTINLMNLIRQAVIECIEADDRLEVFDSNAQIVDDEGIPRISINVDDMIRGGGRTATSSIRYNATTGEIEVN